MEDSGAYGKCVQFSSSTLQFKKSPVQDQEQSPSKELFRYTSAGKTIVRNTAGNSGAQAQSQVSREDKLRMRNGSSSNSADDDIIAMLAKPTWSVRSLLPLTKPTGTITQAQLHHLLRLSALPQPKDAKEEEKMLEALHSQLHFVGDIQKVNTDGVEPLVRIAEETDIARKEATIGLEDVREALDKEVVRGRNRRSRRTKQQEAIGLEEDWDVFQTASETVDVPGSGRYFVVRSGKGNVSSNNKVVD
jgi:Asp-tRNA(Asn)/Glu-tRNA(Gln) amidotransferase C subunit